MDFLFGEPEETCLENFSTRAWYENYLDHLDEQQFLRLKLCLDQKTIADCDDHWVIYIYCRLTSWDSRALAKAVDLGSSLARARLIQHEPLEHQIEILENLADIHGLAFLIRQRPMGSYLRLRAVRAYIARLNEVTRFSEVRQDGPYLVNVALDIAFDPALARNYVKFLSSSNTKRWKRYLLNRPITDEDG